MLVGTLRSLHRYPVKSMAGETLEALEVSAGGVVGDRILALRDDVRREIRGGKQWPVLMTCSARFGDADSIEVTLPNGEVLRATDPALAKRLSVLIGKPVSVCPLEPADNLEHYRRARPGVRLAGVVARSKTGRQGLQRLLALTRQDADLRSDFGRQSDEPLPDLSDFPAEVFEFTSPPGTYFDAFSIHLLTTATLQAMAQKNPGAAWDVRRFRPNFVLETAPELQGFVENGWAGRTLRVGELVLDCKVAAPRCSMVMQAQAGVARDPSVLRTIVRDADQKLGLYASVQRPGRVRVGDVVELI